MHWGWDATCRSANYHNVRRLHSRTLACFVKDSQLCRHLNLACALSWQPTRTRRPTRALQLNSRVDVRVAARHHAAVPTPGREDRLPVHREAPRHVGALDWEHRRREGQRVERGRFDAGEQEAKISRSLAVDDEVRDDSRSLFFVWFDVI